MRPARSSKQHGSESGDESNRHFFSYNSYLEIHFNKFTIQPDFVIKKLVREEIFLKKYMPVLLYKLIVTDLELWGQLWGAIAAYPKLMWTIEDLRC